MNIRFLSLDTSNAEARAVWQDPAVDMIVVGCPDGLHIVFGAPLAGMRFIPGGELGIATIFDPDGWVICPEEPSPSINAKTWGEVLESL